MHKINKFTRKNLLIWLAFILVPLLAMVLGGVLLVGDVLFNLAFAVTYIVLPLVSIALLALTVFVIGKFRTKIILAVVIWLVFVVLFVNFWMLGHFETLTYTKDAEIGESYTEVCETFDLMPTFEEAGDYTSAEHYDYFSSVLGIFTCDADTLIVHYDAEEYQKQKELLEHTYIFEETDMDALGHICAPFAEIEGHLFRVLAIDGEYGSEIHYPNKFLTVATNDTECSIAYTAFYDDDRGFLESLTDFLLSDCGWKHILK